MGATFGKEFDLKKGFFDSRGFENRMEKENGNKK